MERVGRTRKYLSRKKAQGFFILKIPPSLSLKIICSPRSYVILVGLTSLNYGGLMIFRGEQINLLGKSGEQINL